MRRWRRPRRGVNKREQKQLQRSAAPHFLCVPLSDAYTLLSPLMM
jgi:hypothetical protein